MKILGLILGTKKFTCHKFLSIIEVKKTKKGLSTKNFLCGPEPRTRALSSTGLSAALTTRALDTDMTLT